MRLHAPFIVKKIATFLSVLFLLALTSHQAFAATFQMQTGYYMGDGVDNRAITGVGFQPQLIIIKDDSGNGSLGSVWKSSAMSGETSALLADATADIGTDAIQSLDSDGFTLGTNADVNGANVRFTWVAFRGSDCTSSGTFCVGSYTGDAASTHALTSTGFTPNMVVIKGSGATTAAYMTSSMPTNDSQSFSAANEVSDGSVFKTLDSTGFTVGPATRVNSSSTNYWFFAFKSTSNAFSVGTFTGDGLDNKAITAPGYKPNLVWLKNANATTPVRAEFNLTETFGDYSGAFSDSNNAIGQIKSLDTNGFTVGTDVAANESGKTLYWAAFGGASNPSGSGTYKMKVGTYTGNGTSQSLSGFGFTPDVVMIKDAAAATQSVFRTSMMKGDSTSYLANTSANFTGGITSLDSTGFSVGADATVNTNATVYHYQAFGNAFNPEKNTGAADFMVGAYTGAAIDNRNISRMPFQPDLVAIKPNSAASGMWRTSDETGDASMGFSGVAESTDNIQGFNSDGFQVGTSTRVNGGTVTVFNFFSFKTSSTFYVNHYSGTGSAQNITAIGFSPDLLWNKSTGGFNAVFRPSTLVGNSTLFFVATAVQTDRLTAFLSNGFSVGGSQSETNINATTYRYAAWKINATPPTPSLDSPADAATGQSVTPSLLTTGTDTESDYLRYKIELCTNVGMSVGCQTFDQTSSQTGWSGQNTQTSTAYTSGTQATYTVQSALAYGTTYYWRSYAIDPGGSNTFGGTQTPRSFTTLAVPSAPSTLSGSAASTTSITWSFTDNASNETGFRVLTTGGTTQCTVASPSSGTGGTVTCTESGLSPNTSYTRKVVASNAAGDSIASSNASAVTLSTAPTSGNVTNPVATSTWTNTSTFTFTNTLGFGAGSVQYFRYVWDTTSTHTFNDTETQWSSSTLAKTATSDSNSWYLHVKGYNSADVANGTVNLGPYYFDGTAPATPGTPTSASPASLTTPTWTWSASSDASSGLTGTPYTLQWSQDAAFLSGVSSATSATTSYTHSTPLIDGTWYFRVKATDVAGNDSSYSSNGSHSISTSTPSGSITINGGASSTNSSSVTLTLSASDGVYASNLLSMKISNNSDLSGASYESFASSKSWTLASPTVDGSKTVYVRYKNPSNVESGIYSASIIYDTTAPLNFSIKNPSDHSYIQSSRPTYQWNVPANADAGSGLSHFRLEVSNGSTGSFSIDNIPVTGTADVENETYRIHFDGFADSDPTNNFVSVQTKSSASWGSDKNGGELKEGSRDWKVVAYDNVGNTRTAAATVFVDTSAPDVTLSQLNDIHVQSSQYLFSTTDRTPTFFGKSTDRLNGDSVASRVASGLRNVVARVEKKNSFGVYELYSLTTIALNLNYWEDTGSMIVDTSLNQSNKYSPFEFTPSAKLPLGSFRLTLTGSDQVDNEGSLSVNFTVAGISQVATPEEQAIIEKETEKLPPVEKQKVQAELEITKEQTPGPTMKPTQAVVPVQKGMNLLSRIFGFSRSAGQFIAAILQRGMVDIARSLQAPKQFASRFGDWIAYTKTSFTEIVMDSNPTQISELHVETSTPTSMVVTWKTNHLATSKVSYGPTADYGKDVQSTDKVHEHRVEITGLTPGTLYNYEVMSQGKNYVYDANHQFTTPE